MGQPIKKSRKHKVVLTGLDYCNECPFLGMDMNDNWVCNPNDYVFGKTNDKIPVPKWCGNSKSKI